VRHTDAFTDPPCRCYAAETRLRPQPSPSFRDPVRRRIGAGTLLTMPAPDDIEARVAALEARIGRVAADAQIAREDAAAARHLAAARDRDLADLTVKVDANRSAINALGEQTRERFDVLEGRFDALEQKVDDGFRRIDEQFRKVDNGFIEMRGKFDMTAAWLQQIVGLLEQRGIN
jgi:BMFP domain-containing protein YqiC